MQVCIAFALHRGIVVIPKTVTPSRLVENIKATEIKLDAEDMKRLRQLESKNNFRLISVSLKQLQAKFMRLILTLACHLITFI